MRRMVVGLIASSRELRRRKWIVELSIGSLVLTRTGMVASGLSWALAAGAIEAPISPATTAERKKFIEGAP